MRIFVSPYQKGKNLSGYIVIESNGRRFIFDKDEVRQMYYAVLDIQMPETFLDQEFQAVFEYLPSHMSVDVPEDIIKCEIVLEANNDR